MTKNLKLIEDSLPSKNDLNKLSLYVLTSIAKNAKSDINEIGSFFEIQELKGYPKLQYLFKLQYTLVYARICDSIIFEKYLLKNLAGGIGYIDDLKGSNGKLGQGFPLQISIEIIKKAALAYFKEGQNDIGVFVGEVTIGKQDELKSFGLSDTLPREAIWQHCLELAKRKRNSNSPQYSATIFEAGAKAVIGKTIWMVVESQGIKRWVKSE